MRFTEEDCIEAESEAERLSLNKELARLPTEYIAVQCFLKTQQDLKISMCGTCDAVAKTSKVFIEQEPMYLEMSVRSLLILFHGMNKVLYNNKICFELCPDCHNHSGTRRRCQSCPMWSCNKCHGKYWVSKNVCDRCSVKCTKCWNPHRKDEHCTECSTKLRVAESSSSRRSSKRSRRHDRHKSKSSKDVHEVILQGSSSRKS